MIYAPLVEKGMYLTDLAEHSLDELRGMVKLINRLETFRHATGIVKRYENGADTMSMSAEDSVMIERYTREVQRAQENGYTN